MWQILLSSLRLTRDVLWHIGPEEQHPKIDSLTALENLIQDADGTGGAAGFRLHLELLETQGRVLQVVASNVVKWYREAITPATRAREATKRTRRSRLVQSNGSRGPRCATDLSPVSYGCGYSQRRAGRFICISVPAPKLFVVLVSSVIN